MTEATKKTNKKRTKKKWTPKPIDPNAKSVEEEIADAIEGSFTKVIENPEAAFVSSVVGGFPINGSTGNDYNGMNIGEILIALTNADKSLPIVATQNQIFSIMKEYKQFLPEKSDTFDPDYALKGVKFQHIGKVIKFVETYSDKNGKVAGSKKIGKELVKDMSESALNKNGIKKGGYRTRGAPIVSIEDVEHLLPQEYKDKFPQFKMKEELDKLKMNPEKENLHYLQMTHNLEAALGINKIINEKGNQIYYSPTEDTVTVLPRHRFTSDKNLFYGTSHECHHWTGHKTRLNREFATSVDPAYERKYALEEIKCELANAFTCIKLGVPTELQHASYIKSYVQSISGGNDNKVFYSAYKDALKASNYVTERYEGYVQKMEQTLKDTLDKDLKAEPAMVSDGKVYQTFSLADQSDKTFIVIVSLDGKAEPIIKNKSVFNEFVESKEPKGDLDKFEASLKSNFKEYATANYALNKAVLDDKEKKRKAEKLEEKPEQDNKNKNERPKLKA